jgi:ACR3 family arsenite efflux pump ArsB
MRKQHQIESAHRILITINLYFVVSGYLAHYQTKYQLISPLIPESITDTIIADSNNFEASISTAIFLLIGILFYSFNKKLIGLILMGISLIIHQVIINYSPF